MNKKGSVIKLGVVGDGGVGKTSLIRAKKDAMFLDDSKITIGVNIEVIPFEFQKIEGNEASFIAMDLGGQERFHFIHDAYIKGIKVAIIAYDLSRHSTFLHIPKWFDLVTNQNQHIPILVVGTKKDLVDEDKLAFYETEFEMYREFMVESGNHIEHHFISSKSGSGVQELFEKCEMMAKELTEKPLVALC